MLPSYRNYMRATLALNGLRGHGLWLSVELHIFIFHSITWFLLQLYILNWRKNMLSKISTNIALFLLHQTSNFIQPSLFGSIFSQQNLISLRFILMMTFPGTWYSHYRNEITLRHLNSVYGKLTPLLGFYSSTSQLALLHKHLYLAHNLKDSNIPISLEDLFKEIFTEKWFTWSEEPMHFPETEIMIVSHLGGRSSSCRVDEIQCKKI